MTVKILIIALGFRLKIKESQNHRTGVGRDLKEHQTPTPCHGQGCPPLLLLLSQMHIGKENIRFSKSGIKDDFTTISFLTCFIGFATPHYFKVISIQIYIFFSWLFNFSMYWHPLLWLGLCFSSYRNLMPLQICLTTSIMHAN